MAALTSLLALAQRRATNDVPAILKRMKLFPFQKLPVSQRLVATRIYGLILAGVARLRKDIDPMSRATGFALSRQEL